MGILAVALRMRQLGSTPTPAAGQNALYFKSDDKLYMKNSAGVETVVATGSGSGGSITLLDVYPVGSIYMSVNATNPGSVFGGTWAAWGTGRVPVGINTADTDFDVVEETGGSKSVTISTSNLPPHVHDMTHTHTLAGRAAPQGTQANVHVQASGSIATVDATTSGASQGATGNGSFGNNPLNTMPPYITCYMWKRTA